MRAEEAFNRFRNKRYISLCYVRSPSSKTSQHMPKKPTERSGPAPCSFLPRVYLQPRLGFKATQLLRVRSHKPYPQTIGSA